MAVGPANGLATFKGLSSDVVGVGSSISLRRTYLKLPKSFDPSTKSVGALLTEICVSTAVKVVSAVRKLRVPIL
jgi:hypothetical protein